MNTPRADNPAAGGLAPWAQPSAAAWARAGEATLVTDMTTVRPAAALSRESEPGAWRVVDYEADGRAGKMLLANGGTNAPALTLPLNAGGWYAVFVGLYSTVLTPCQVWLKLTGDKSAQLRLSKPTGEDYWSIQEVFFKVARLDGESLEIMQQSEGYGAACGVTHVKLVPLSPEEVNAFTADRARADTRTMAATSDGYSFLWSYRPTTEESLRREIERFRGSDYGTLLLHIGGADITGYPSRVGRMFGDVLRDFVEPGQRYASESVRELARQGINPFKVWIDAARELGMKVHAGVRPALWSYYEPHTPFFTSPFYRDHPEWRCVDRDGRQVARMSWAVPEVRRHLIEVLREAVGFGADGAHIVFNRGFPMTLYEEPAARIFRDRHGCEMRGLDESDPRIGALWAELVSVFMRETRAMLEDEARRRGGGKLALSVCVLGTEADNLRYGLDVRALVEAGLIDEVYVYCYDFGARDRRFDVAWFHSFCRPRGVRVVPMFSSPYITEAAVAGCAREAMGFYDAGADGVAVWDPHMAGMGSWLSAGRMGHREELPLVAERGQPAGDYLRVTRVGDTVMDGRFPPFWGG